MVENEDEKHDEEEIEKKDDEEIRGDNFNKNATEKKEKNKEEKYSVFNINGNPSSSNGNKMVVLSSVSTKTNTFLNLGETSSFFLILFLMGFHLIDYFLWHLTRGRFINIILTAFFAFLIFLIHLYYDNFQELKNLFLLISFSIWFPFIISFLKSFNLIYGFLVYFYLFFNPLIFYVVYKTSNFSFSKKLLFIYFFLLIIYFLIFVVLPFFKSSFLFVNFLNSNFNIDLTSTTSINDDVASTGFFQQARDNIMFFFERTKEEVYSSTGIDLGIDSSRKEIIDNSGNKFNRLGKNRTNGSLYKTKFFYGTLENNRKKKIGVYFESVEPVSKVFFEGSTPTIIATLFADSFVQNIIKINPACIIKRKDLAKAGIPNPPVLELPAGTMGSFTCSFLDLPRGFYHALVTAGFNFDTWADITYNVISFNELKKYSLAGKNIYQELKIPKIPRSIYTNGPLSIGIGGGQNPIIVYDKALTQGNKENKESSYVNTILGISLKTTWLGSLNKINYLIISIPDDFFLDSCNFNFDEEESEIEGYVDYVFKDIKIPGQKYLTISCNLKGRESLKELLSSNNLITRTFLVRANYDFVLERPVTFKIE